MHLIFDFDSTLVQGEGLDLLAEICLKGDLEKIHQITEITELGMNGKIEMQESLQARLDILRATRSDIECLVDLLKVTISPSIQMVRKMLSEYKTNLYVISGGFLEYVSPICREIGFSESNIIANKFIYNGQHIVGFDQEIKVSRNLGKPSSIRDLNLSSPIYLVGDGYTDLEAKLFGAVDYFIAYTETVQRQSILEQADYICNNFHEVYKIIHEQGI